MKELPILFSAPMVRALLEGRKTQTRRIVKEPRWAEPGGLDMYYDDRLCAIAKVSGCLADVECPHGKPGDRLWVRETHAIMSTDTGTASVAYRERMPEGETLADTDGGLNVISLSPEEWRWADSHIDYERWRPSIFMPRWASRITLEITEVRVQRLQEISEGDAKAEGCEPWAFGAEQTMTSGERGADLPYRGGYACLWDEINSDRATWKSNPWVWAITFKAVKP